MPTPRFSDVRRLEEVDSTNRLAADLARAGAPDGVVVVADHQTAGRGRRGRSWEAGPGSSLLVSVVLRPAPLLVTLLAGVAAVDACLAAAGVDTTLKWPNDVLLAAGGGKVGGILAEAVGGAAVVGLGLNVDWSGPLPPGGAALGPGADRHALLEAWLAGLDDAGDVLGRYRARCSTLGRRVRVLTPAGTVEGTAQAIAEDGRLVVDGEAIAAGDVVHVR